MEHFKDNSGCSGPKKSEIFWNNSRKVQYVFAGGVKSNIQCNSTSDVTMYTSLIKGMCHCYYRLIIN